MIQLLGLGRVKGKEPGDWEARWAGILILPFNVCCLSHIYCGSQMHEWGTGVSIETIGHMFTQHMGQPSREPPPSCQWNRVVKKITGLGGSLCAMKCSSEQCKFINKFHKYIYSCNRANVVQRRTRMPTKHVISGTQASSQSWEDPDIFSDAGGRLQRMFWRKALEPMIWAQSLIRKLSVCEIWKAGSVEDQGQK